MHRNNTNVIKKNNHKCMKATSFLTCPDPQYCKSSNKKIMNYLNKQINTKRQCLTA